MFFRYASILARLCLAASLFAVVAACSDDGAATSLTVDARKAAGSSASPAAGEVTAPLDLASLVRRVRLGFRGGEDGFTAGFSSHRCAVANDGSFSVSPLMSARAVDPSAGREELVEGAAIELETVAVERGGRDLSEGRGKLRRRDDGGLELSRGSALERFHNREQGLEQSFELGAEPAGDGDLTIRVAVGGAPYRGATSGGLHFGGGEDRPGLRYGKASWIDATGRRTEIDPTFADGEIEILVPAGVVEGARYPVVVDPVISAEFGADQQAPLPLNEESSGADVAHDGTNYLVVFDDNHDIIGARVAADGSVLDEGGFDICAAADTQRNPAVAFDGTAYTAVWEDQRDSYQDDIYGGRVGTDGAPLDGNGFAICTATGYQTNPRIGHNGTSYLAVWQDGRNTSQQDVYGAMLDSDGTVSAADVEISVMVTNQYRPDVACTGGGCLVVWQDDRDGSNYKIYGSRVDAAGGVQDPGGLLLGDESAACHGPSIGAGGGRYLLSYESSNDRLAARLAADGTFEDAEPISVAAGHVHTEAAAVSYGDGQFLLAWRDERDGYELDSIYAARVTDAGALLDAGGFRVSDNAFEEGSPAAASDGTDFLVAWHGGVSTSAERVRGARVSGDGEVLDDELFPGGELGWRDQSAPDVAYGNGVFLVVFADERNWYASQGSDIFGVRVDTGGAILDPAGIEIAAVSGYQEHPSVAFDGENFLVVWDDTREYSYEDIYCARVGSDGTVLDPYGVRIAYASYDEYTHPDVAFDGEAYLVVWDFEHTYIYGRIVSTEGDPLGSGYLTIGSAANYQRYPQVASNGDDFLVVWEDSRNSDYSYDIYGARVSALYGLLDPDGIAIASLMGLQQNPAVASDGSGYLVVWQDERFSANEDIYGARVDEQGQVVDTDGFAVAVAGGSQSRPAVALGGDEYIVAFADTRNASTSGADIYGARVDSAGQSLDPAGFEVSAEDGDEALPALAHGGGVGLVAYERPVASLDDFSRARMRLWGAGVDLPDGEPCSSGAACLSGFCVDGVCCGSACGGDNPSDCQACSIEAGASADGVCETLGSSVECRPEAGDCDVAESCDGSSVSCPDDEVLGGGTVCRAAAGDCDVAESCSGSSPLCPTDQFEPASTECRASAGECDPAENCTGSGSSCPADLKSTGVCRAAAGPCDLAEHCDGVNDDCPNLDVKSTDVCRSAAGLCDQAEYCDGTSDDCPADGFLPDSTVCRTAAGDCDVAESCTGGSAQCPVDGFSLSGVECRAAAGPCDVAESCTGTEPDCPADALRPSGYQCRAAAGECDLAEQCDGSDPGCPIDDYRSSTFVCREALGVCDAAERCTGVDPNCPADELRPSGFECRPVAGLCDLAESCTGSSVDCPHDGYEDASTVCRPADGECDLAESCTGTSAECPEDEKSTALCRDAAGVCDALEFCNGVADDCPADAKSTGECRAAGGPCDPAEHCGGTGDDCPADVVYTDGEPCDDGDPLTWNDSCDSEAICQGEPSTGSCAAPIQADADVYEDASTTVGAPSSLSDYAPACGGAGQSTPDMVYVFDLAADEQLEVSVDPASDFDLALRLVDACEDGAQCLAAADEAGEGAAESALFAPYEEALVYVVIEGAAPGEVGGYLLSAEIGALGPDAGPDADVDTDVDTDTDTDMDTDTDTDADTDTDTDTDADTDTGTDADTDSDADSDSVSDTWDTADTSDTGSDSDSDTDSDSDSSGGVCQDGRTICFGHAVYVCENGVWTEWDDCVQQGLTCVMIEGEAICAESDAGLPEDEGGGGKSGCGCRSVGETGRGGPLGLLLEAIF